MMLALLKPSFEFDEKKWAANWVSQIKVILREIDSTTDFSRLTEFLAWFPQSFKVEAKEDKCPKNTYIHHGKGGEEVEIRLGSIHSVKGQTHTATLVLDTFNRAYHFNKLQKCVTHKPYTVAQRTNSLMDRMKLHYVAATRPTHLLCIAARKDHFTKKDIAHIKDSGTWKVTVLSGE